MNFRNSLVKELRKHYNMSQLELAAAAKISLVTLARFESDPDCNPQLNTIVALAEALHVDYRIFLNAPTKPMNNSTVAEKIVKSLGYSQ